MDIYNLKFIGEETDITPVVTRNNTVIKTSYGYKLLNAASSYETWNFCIIFPDKEKAEYFLNNCKNKMYDYRDNMLKDDYFVHIVHFKYPKQDSLYADQIKMTKNWEKEEY